MKKETITILAVVLICATILGVSYNFRKTGISIRNTGTASGSIQNSITVSGEGKVMSRPDIVRVQAGVSELRKTTKEAQIAANEKLAQILDILRENNIAEKNVQTTDLSFYPEYQWLEKTGQKLVGQRVRQTLNIKITDIDKKSERVTDILDALGSVDGLEMNSVNFDIEEKEALFTQARQQAFDKAEQKAKELAKLGGVVLLKPITISESSINYNPPMYRNFAKMEMASDAMGGGSELPSGELEVTANVNVVFGIE
ncbi:SIMPL domain-containing protein [Candidatus Gracilibacteria bacterium]|nr:SIMPL domain-containing protein [Candidatus Gracilibacteria bacterium]